MFRVMTIYGTRPEAIKMAPLIMALRGHAHLEPVVAVTGQHREMLDQVHACFGIEPDHDLDLMTPGSSLAQIGAIVLRATTHLLRVRPARPGCEPTGWLRRLQPPCAVERAHLRRRHQQEGHA